MMFLQSAPSRRKELWNEAPSKIISPHRKHATRRSKIPSQWCFDIMAYTVNKKAGGCSPPPSIRKDPKLLSNWYRQQGEGMQSKIPVPISEHTTHSFSPYVKKKHSLSPPVKPVPKHVKFNPPSELDTQASITFSVQPTPVEKQSSDPPPPKIPSLMSITFSPQTLYFIRSRLHYIHSRQFQPPYYMCQTPPFAAIIQPLMSLVHTVHHMVFKITRHFGLFMP